MFAEYEGIMDGRNICENRPNGAASARANLKSFVPGQNEDRKIHQFEEQIVKNKLREDKNVYKGGVPPPLRLLLDSNCNIQIGQDENIQKGKNIAN